MQRIKHMRWFPYRIPFRASFTTAHGTLTSRIGAIVEIITDDDLFGIGEIAPMPEFAGDDLGTALAPLPRLSSQLLNWNLLDALNFLYTEMARLPATTLCGLESALLDAMGKSLECGVMDAMGSTGVINLSHHSRGKGRGGAGWGPWAYPAAPMGGAGNDSTPNRVSPRPPPRSTPPLTPTVPGFSVTRGGVPVNMVIGTLSTEDTVARAEEAVEMGYSCIKLKVGSGHPEVEIERIAAVRAAIGPAIHLRLDANAGWTLAEAMTILSSCAAYDIQYVEQPLPADDLDGLHTLRNTVPVPIAADEALYDLESARRILAHEAAEVLIIKPQLAGGLQVGRQIISEATHYGVQCVITSTLESGVGIAGALHLAAASPEVTMECGLATLHLLTDDLLIDGLTLDHGLLAVPEGSGLGIHLDRNALAYYKKH